MAAGGCSSLLRGCKVEEGRRQDPPATGRAGGQANAALAPYGKKIGPDPASVAIASIGAFCRTTPAACPAAWCRTLITRWISDFRAASGTVIDTASPDADEQFRLKEPELARTLLS